MRLVALIVLASALVAGGSTGDSNLRPATWPPKYLALGDSLAVSYQPPRAGARAGNDGYVEAVWRARSGITSGLQLVKLGRGGETAASMISSTKPGPSQLQQALHEIRTGSVALVTIDIGANEVERCSRSTDFDAQCVKSGLASLRKNLPRIIQRLRAAGGEDLRIIGINYYNSFLGRWVTGKDGRRLALASVPVERSINAALSDVYSRMKVPIADVEDRFGTDQIGRYTRTRDHGTIPLAVARTCHWTWACAAQYDDHTNSLGYRVIAREVLALL